MSEEATRQQRIMIVEDEAIVAEALRTRLVRLDYEVTACVATGEEAVATAAATAPDLILMDINLAGGSMDGIQAAAAIRQHQDVPVIFLTAFSDYETLQRAKGSAPYGYLVKPIDGHELHTAVDIALYKHAAERRLRASEARYRYLFEQSVAAIFLADCDGRVIDANARACEMSGRSRDQLLAAQVLDLHPPEAADRAREAFARTCGGDDTRFESQLLRPNGTRVDVEIVATVIEPEARIIQGIVVDITERKRAEAGRDRLGTAVAHAGEAVMITDRDGVITYVNDAFCQLTGYDSDLAIGKRPNILRSGSHDPDFYRELWQTITAGKTWSGRIVNRIRSGELRQQDATISPFLDHDGAIQGFVAVERDVTDQVTMERRLRQAQKMEAIGTLAGGIAHDFNNVLGAIIGYADLLIAQRDGGRVPEWKYIDRIVAAGTRAKSLVAQILAFSRRNESERVPIHLGTIVKETAKLLRGALPATIEIVTAIDADDDVLLTDPTQIHQVIMNLGTNAWHAMREDGGTLTITLAERLPETASPPPFPPNGPPLVLSVADTGRGIPADIADRIFDPFFTTKGSGEGTGMGLAVVHGIATGHGGTVLVESQPGRGTCFHVLLPRGEPSALTQAQETDAVEAIRSAPRGSERILFVDDEIDLASLGSQLLESLGYTTVTCSSGEEALAAFRQAPESFALVVTDITMPRMTGLELARRVHAIRPGIPVLACTGFRDAATEGREAASGIARVLVKPVLHQELAAAVRELIDQTDA